MPEGPTLQIPLRTISTIESYVATKEWSRAQLSCCPLHPDGGCTFRRHGSYARLSSPGVRIARYYCPEGRTTFSLLPDFLSARLPDSLAAIEQIIGMATSARSIEKAADAVRGSDICLPGAVRWLRRRITAVRKSVAAVNIMAPGLSHLVTNDMLALRELRRVLPPQLLLDIPVPLGFRLASRMEHHNTLGYLAAGVVRQKASAMPRQSLPTRCGG